MKLLVIETASDTCSCALLSDTQVYADAIVAPRRHADLLLDMVARALAQAEMPLAKLDGLGFGCGPGSFTGVRIAASVAQGLALGLDVGVAPISSLRILAQGIHRQYGAERVLAGFDARIGEVYWGAYRVDERGLMRTAADSLSRPEQVDIASSAATWTGAGSAWAAYRDALGEVVGGRLSAVYAQAMPVAIDGIGLAQQTFARGEAVPADRALPVYLRDRVAVKSTRPS